MSSHDQEALAMLVEAGVLNEGVTLSQMMEVSARLEDEFGGGDSDIPPAWKFIVKGKFCFQDDEKATAVATLEEAVRQNPPKEAVRQNPRSR